MREIEDCTKIKKRRQDSYEVHRMKILLCKLGKKLGFKVSVEEEPESELGALGIRHDVLWYSEKPEWYTSLLDNITHRTDLEDSYRQLINEKKQLRYLLYAAFEIEGGDVSTKAMKGDVSNLSKLPLGVIIVRRGRNYAKENIRRRFERAIIEFRKLHGPNNVLIISFEDIEKLCGELGIN